MKFFLQPFQLSEYMSGILDKIVVHKKTEIKALYEQFDLPTLQRVAQPSQKNFYNGLSASRQAGIPFFITEFKRKSPSEGWINRDAEVPVQVRDYASAGAGAISVLTDSEFFGGSYQDLKQASATLADLDRAPLLLQKDFILDPIQLYLARLHGADIILLIAAILSPDRLEQLLHIAESLGMGALVEVHNREELEKIGHLDFPVLGINNRDLYTFRTALNRVNVLRKQASGRFIIAESGIHDYRDFQVLREADGYLIGTSLMRDTRNAQRLGSASEPRRLFKACGIRSPGLLNANLPDFIGLNFSPVSKRRIDPALLEGQVIPGHAVAVFYQNSETEIRDILARYPFRRAQFYAGDVSPEFVRSLPQKVLLACRVREPEDLKTLEAYAPDIDLFILDGAQPGSGKRIETAIPADFPYPFLLAGGLSADNIEGVFQHPNCIGVDIASGIETAGAVDPEKIERIAKVLINAPAAAPLPNP